MPRSFLVKKTEKSKNVDHHRNRDFREKYLARPASPVHHHAAMELTQPVSPLSDQGYQEMAEPRVPAVVHPAPPLDPRTVLDRSPPGGGVLDLTVRSEPVVGAVAPYTPSAFQPLAVRLSNGK